MDLWIRSQDKELLVKVKEIELGEYDDYYCLVVNNLQNIGNYKTKERALEIIDEIHCNIENIGQSYIKSNENGIPDEFICYGKVYEMPKE